MSKELSARMWTTKLNKNQLENTDYVAWRIKPRRTIHPCLVCLQVT